MLAAGARAGGPRAGRRTRAGDADRGHGSSPRASPEKQWPARSSPAETSARRLRSRRKVTGDWRKAPRGEEPRGLSERRAGGCGRGGGSAARGRTGGARPWREFRAEPGPRWTAGTVTQRLCPETRQARAGESEAETTEAKAGVWGGSGPPRPLPAPRGQGRRWGQGTLWAEPSSNFGNKQPLGLAPAEGSRPGAAVEAFFSRRYRSTDPCSHLSGCLGSGTHPTPAGPV